MSHATTMASAGREISSRNGPCPGAIGAACPPGSGVSGTDAPVRSVSATRAPSPVAASTSRRASGGGSIRNHADGRACATQPVATAPDAIASAATGVSPPACPRGSSSGCICSWTARGDSAPHSPRIVPPPAAPRSSITETDPGIATLPSPRSAANLIARAQTGGSSASAPAPVAGSKAISPSGRQGPSGPARLASTASRAIRCAGGAAGSAVTEIRDRGAARLSWNCMTHSGAPDAVWNTTVLPGQAVPSPTSA